MLNPWGDIITIARASCVTKDWGYLTIGVQYGDAKLPFNAGDVKIRYVIFSIRPPMMYPSIGSGGKSLGAIGFPCPKSRT
jgi:hypothetical protein